MATFAFQIDGAQLQGIKPGGGTAFAPAGYYRVRITDIQATDKPDSGKLILSLESGHEVWDWMNTPHTGLEDRQIKGRLGGIRAVLESLGWAAADIENPANKIHAGWFIYSAQMQREGFIEYVPPIQGVEGSRAIINWITKERYETMKASGAVPQRPAETQGTTRAASAPPTPPSVPGPVGGPPQVAPPAYTQPPVTQQVAPPVVSGAPGGFPPPPPPPR